MTILVSIIFMGCGQATKSVSTPSENNIKKEKSIFGISEAKRVDSDRNINVGNPITFSMSALLVFLLQLVYLE